MYTQDPTLDPGDLQESYVHSIEHDESPVDRRGRHVRDNESAEDITTSAPNPTARGTSLATSNQSSGRNSDTLSTGVSC